MPKLEYRMLNESEGYPILYYYDSMDRTEIAIRLACDYFVKDGVTYEKTSGAIEAGCYVIYVKKAEEQDNSLPQLPNPSGKLRLELRQYVQNSSYFPEVAVFELKDNLDALLYLQSDFLYWLGQEWQKTSAEIDEDRKVYIFYATTVC
ncbi:hypothetical protein [Sporomusa malonica]|uniref:Uncharacterized protein n=1 Tax=Sporomusa malonica TaxID=112901 RepID=A0A1W1ZPM8_9FIRM|nr:hypothetical protein [Sporomusa malonica]SMC50505.1 hypothetical protein SAMN04488500_104106 [Sporomusa malonica]